VSGSIVIIGSGLAGFSVLKNLRQLDSDQDITMITQDDGAFYSKPMLSTALAKGKNPDSLLMMSACSQAEKLKANIVTNTTVSLINTGDSTVTYGNTTLPYDSLVLATGGKVRSPSLTGNAAADVLTVNSLTDYRVFYSEVTKCKKVAILGAGLVGLELANDLLALNIEVSIVEPSSAPLPALLPAKLGDIFVEKFGDAGIDWHLNCTAVSVNKNSNLSSQNSYELALSDQSILAVDAVVSAIGISPNVRLAANAGLAVDHGVVVDQHGRTHCENVYALGDCAVISGQWRPHIMPIAQASKVIARNINVANDLINYPAMAVIAKTPLCPIVAALPMDHNGDWHYEGENGNWRALCYSDTGQLLGFVLLGDMVKEHSSLIKQMPDYL